MPEPQQPGQAPGDAEPQQPQPPPAAEGKDGQEAEDTFDAERAKALITKLRGFERQAKDQAKELETLKAEQKKREESELSELERSKRRIEELEQQTQEREREVRDLRLRGAIEREARELRFADPQDAHDLLLARNSLEFDEEGTPTNLPKALKALAESKPYLVSQAQPPAPLTPSTPVPVGATPRPSNGQGSVMQAELDRIRQQTAQRARTGN
jgi:septal ring factor EnvC (AmiA/AmiB activator)